MDGFTGFKSAAAEELPDSTTVMDPFHVVRLAGDALDECRRRVQQQLHARRGRATDPLYKARRVLHTRSSPLTRCLVGGPGLGQLLWAWCLAPVF
ncbi:transposase domain protein [Schaalia georgiae F0490]|uniref:Transposase domain protein n=1 Tax=Schaalia georgiae F0490 TaxID=1125717 RepID=J1HYT3_9ACTO|nr:transposase domain protein [Schaalia georgiae F0490]